MTDESAGQGGSSAPRRPLERLLRGAFPEAVGLGLVGLIATALIVCTLFAQRTLSEQRALLLRGQAESAARAIAARLAARSDPTGVPAPETLAEIAGSESIASLRWVDADGHERCRWQRAALAAESPEAIEIATAAAPVADPSGKPAGSVSVAVRAVVDRTPERLFLGMAGGLLVAALLAYLALYRLIRRQMRPIDAIRAGLESYASGIESQLQTLHLSDAFGQVARGWNQLIEEIVRLKQQLASAGATSEGDALTRFETRMLRDALERLPVGVVRFGPDEQIHYANSSAARFLGIPQDALRKQRVRDILGDQCETLLGAQRRGARAAADWNREGAGGVSTLRVEILPPREEVSPESILLIQDVTDMREVEQACNSFLYHVTHELRTPLTNIQAYAETLSRLDLNDEQMRKECYNVIVSETRRLSELVEDILSISQMEVGALRLEADDVDMVRLLRTMVQDNLGAADEKGVELSLSLPPKLPRLRGDKRRLAVLLNNLIGNAIKYTPPEGRVSVRASHDERRMRIEVADTGLGIAPEDQPRVFEKFYRADRDEVQGIKGTGLGLAIAREVARLHGGDILLESEVGKGSTFTLELPLQAADCS